MAWIRAWREWRAKRPGAVYKTARPRTQTLSHTALADYFDNAGTDMARAGYVLRKEAHSQTALAEARRQHELLWALLDEFEDRQRDVL